MAEAQNGCRLCRILKDFLDQAEKRSQAQRHRLEGAPGVMQTSRQDERLRFVFRLSGSYLVISTPNNVFAGTLQFRPTTNPGDPAAEYLPRTTVRLDRGDRNTFDKVRSWVQKCDCTHVSCTYLDRQLPARVIDLSKFDEFTQQLRLYIPKQGEQGRYAALSYCWGYSQPIITSRENLLRHIRDISYHILPQTLQDAVRTTIALGIRFLWIDALCILQNSEFDKQTEIGKMAQIFQDAYVTIVAACSSSSAEGFLQIRDGLPPALEIPVGCNDGKLGSLSLLPTYMASRHEPLHDRAWTLQEIILSRRLLIFGKDSVGWKCAAGDRGLYSWTDWNGYCASTGLTTIRFGPHGNIVRPTLSVFSADISSFRSSSLAERQPYVFRLWREVIRDYSTRTMTNEEDKLSALSGIAAYFQDVMNDVYLAGLWFKHLLLELCWTVPVAKRPAAWRAPSWSWMALDGPVLFQTDRCEWYHPIVGVVSCVVTPAAANAPFSRVTEGTLVLRGWFGSVSSCKTQTTSSLLFADEAAVVMDCGERWDPSYKYLGLAEYVMATYDGHEDGPKLTWGLVLRRVFRPAAALPIYERVGWFTTPIWTMSGHDPYEVNIV